MKTRLMRSAALLLALVLLLCTVGAAAERKDSIFDARWKQVKEIRRNGTERSLIRGNIYAVYEFAEDGTYTSTSYCGDTFMLSLEGDSTIEGNRITLNIMMNIRSGSYAIEGDTLTITWDDGAQFIFERMPE